MKSAPWIAVLLLCAALPAQAQTQKKGEWVLAQYKGGPYWFPGVVQNNILGSITVLYDDGTRELVPGTQVRRYDWRVGTRVECNWKGGGTWYPGEITALRDKKLSIHYDDNDTETTTTGRCRSQ